MTPNLYFGPVKSTMPDGVHVDLDRLYESRLLIQGVPGAGKSTAIRALCEQMFGVVPQLLFDFEGDFVTLREKFDYVLVGKGGDAPLAIKTAKVTQRRLIELNASAIFDLSDLKFGERREYVRICFEDLVHLPRPLQHTRLIILDEGQVFAPERGQGESVATEAVIDLVTLGRKRGLVPIVATQRLSKLHKDVAGNLQNKLIGYTDDVDLQRSGDALGMTKEQRTELKLLETHTFYAYGPAISRAPVLVRTLMPSTKPPPRGQERPPAPPARAAIQKLLAQLVDLPKEAEEEARTVQDLQRRNADLERRIRQAEKTGAVKEVVKTVVDQAAIDRALSVVKNQIRRWTGDAVKLNARLDEITGRAQAVRSGLLIVIEEMGNVATPGARITPKDHRLNPSSPVASLSGSKLERRSDGHARGDSRERPATTEPSRTYTDANSYVSLGKGERKMLAAIAQYPEGAERDQLTVLTGYKRSSRDTYIQRLSSADLVVIENGRLIATQAGIEALGSDFEPLPQGEELQEYWLGRLPEGERKILDILIQQYPSYVERDALSEATGYKRSSRDTYLQRLSSRRLIDIGREGVRASANLFDGALV
jgi:hypothetical protein